MSRAGKWTAWILGGIAVALLVFAATVVAVVRSPWFYNRVRSSIVETVETATGGRVELASFHFDWHNLRAEVRGFVLHGTEPADKPPLLRAESVAVGLKIVSLFKRQVDIASLDVAAPEVYLIVKADGSTNIPQPKVPAKKNGKPAVQTILDLAIGKLSLERGQFEIASRGKSPFSAHGANLTTRFDYDRAGPRYRGDISIQPLDLVLGSYHPMPVGIATSLTVEANRIVVDSARVTSGASNVSLAGGIEDLAAPHGDFKFNASVSVEQATPILRIPELRRGTMEVAGNAQWRGGSDFLMTGTLHGTGLAYRDPSVRLDGFHADGALTVSPAGVDVKGLKLNGSYVTDLGNAPMVGDIATATLRGKDIQLHDVKFSAFGGQFQGEAKVLDLVRYSATGSITNIEARPVVAMYIKDHLLWNGLASGPVNVEGSFQDSSALRATAKLTVTPAGDSAPVHGEFDATFTARDKTVDLGHSTFTLPSSQVDFSGVLGRQMRVHLNTRDLDDLLPAIDERASHLPAKLTGAMVFDGTVSGNIDNPQISGHTKITGIVFETENIDSLEGDADVSPAGVRMHNTTVLQGPMRAQFQMSIGLHDWKYDDNSPLSGDGTLRGGTVTGLATLLELTNLPVTGGAAGAAQISGTLGDTHVSADFQLAAGALRDEPFDRFTGHLNYNPGFIEVTGGQILAGNGMAAVSAAYHHAIGHFDTGHLQLHVSTNARLLEQVHTIQQQYPGLKGTVTVTAAGELDVTPARSGSDVPTYRVTAIEADITGRNLQIADQALGDAHVTVSSQGNLARAHLESNAASSQVRGDGEWRMEGDYPGSATVTFVKLDLVKLRDWLQPTAASTASPFVGSAEGQFRIDGPLLQPQLLKAQLSIPQFEVGPAPGSGLPAGKLVLHNAGPIVATMEGNTITVQSARLNGEATDVSVTGKISLQQRSPLDLHGAGKVDLGAAARFQSRFHFLRYGRAWMPPCAVRWTRR